MRWQDEPATEKQRRFLRFLMRTAGEREPLPERLTKGDGARLIAEYERRKPQDPVAAPQAVQARRHMRIVGCRRCGVRTGLQGDFCEGSCGVGCCAEVERCWNCSGRTGAVRDLDAPRMRLIEGGR